MWNVRGFNNPRKQKDVLGLIHENKVGLCGLVETKIQPKNARNVIQNMFNSWSVTSNFHTHKGGRILVAWLPSVFDITVIMATTEFVHTRVLHIPTGKCWCFTVIYSFNVLGDRQDLWRDLYSIGDSMDILGSMLGTSATS